MALSYKTRKRLSILILVLGLPGYIVVAVSLMNWLYPDPMNKPSIIVELAIYIGLGLLWAIPLKKVFLGIGQADPEEAAAASRSGNEDP
jgi:hypothetical protein